MGLPVKSPQMAKNEIDSHSPQKTSTPWVGHQQELS